MARPKKECKPEYYKQAYKLCLLGATDKELADFFEVSERQINYWKKDYPEFLQSIKRGKSIADAEVADKLFQRATGYEVQETKVFQHNGNIVTYDMIKHFPPDTPAAIFWLKNRNPSKWRDKIEHGITDSDGKIVPLQMTVNVNIPNAVNDEDQIEDIT